MNHIIRIHLENSEDVIRDIQITSTYSLQELHLAIVEAFGLEENQMASFYMTNDNFELLQEIPIFSIKEKDCTMLPMSEIIISSIFSYKGKKLLYVYDFMKMWRFLVTFHEESINIIEGKICINKVGEMPNEAPKIQFNSEKIFDPFEDAFDINDEFNEDEEF